jgi:uncharacterized protein (DUF2147 family)
MKRNVVLLFLALMLTTAASACAASGDEILGAWNNQEKDARIEIFRCAEKYCGKIFSMNEPDYPADSRDGIPGTPRLDHKNPEPSLRSRLIIGLQIMNDFVFVGDGLWENGTVYDPKNGRTYSGRMTLVSPTQLNLRGFIGISLIGRTVIWTR